MSNIHEKAAELISDEKFLVASRLLRTLDPAELTDEEKSTLSLAKQCEILIDALKKEPNTASASSDEETSEEKKTEFGSPEEKGWSKSGKDLRKTIVYYKFNSNEKVIDLRVDTTVERSLLVPILTVLNESDLYKTWLPSWSFPRFGPSASTKLAERGKVSQLCNIKIDTPLKQRDAMIGAFGFEDIDENGDLVIKVNGCQTGDVFLGMTVPPPPDPTIVRSDFSGGFLFRKDTDPYPEGVKKKEDDEDDRVVMKFMFKINPKIRYIPQWLLDFFVGTAVRAVSNMFVNVSREVRDGKREEFNQILKEKADIYDWIKTKADKLFD